MNKEIIGYITGLINVYGSEVKFNTNPIIVGCNKRALNDLNDLLKFVVGIPEENKDIKEIQEVQILAFNVALENVNLKKKIAELEETNRRMNCVGQSLREDIKQYKESLVRSTKRAETLRNRIVELEKSCSDMCDIERNLQKKIDKLTGPRWLQD